jgi:transposase
MWHFCVDVDATKTALLTGLNRNTINRYFRLFREAVYLHQSFKLDKLIGEVELDESYFGGKRIRGYHGKLKRGCNNPHILDNEFSSRVEFFC